MSAIFLLGACATEPEGQDGFDRTADEVSDTAQQPLRDFNVIRDEIPEILSTAKADPYAKLPETNCQSLTAEIRELNFVLGADLDIADESDRTALDVTFSLARGLALGFIPFRGVAREVTGAEAHDRAFNEAVLAGTVRRAYLKGVGESLGCTYPGAPLRRAE